MMALAALDITRRLRVDADGVMYHSTAISYVNFDYGQSSTCDAAIY